MIELPVLVFRFGSLQKAENRLIKYYRIREKLGRLRYEDEFKNNGDNRTSHYNRMRAKCVLERGSFDRFGNKTATLCSTTASFAKNE